MSSSARPIRWPSRSALVAVDWSRQAQKPVGGDHQCHDTEDSRDDRGQVPHAHVARPWCTQCPARLSATTPLGALRRSIRTRRRVATIAENGAGAIASTAIARSFAGADVASTLRTGFSDIQTASALLTTKSRTADPEQPTVGKHTVLRCSLSTIRLPATRGLERPAHDPKPLPLAREQCRLSAHLLASANRFGLHGAGRQYV